MDYDLRPVDGRRRLSSRLGLQSQDLVGSELCRRHDHSRRVSGDHAREDRPVDDEQVVGAVDLGVKVDDSRTVLHAAVIQAQFGRAWRRVSNGREGSG